MLSNSNFDIISFSEIGKNKDFCEMIRLPGYKIASLFCRKKHTLGGVCIAIKECFDYIVRDDIVKFSKEFIIEFSAIEIPQINTIVIGLYRADRSANIFYEQMTKVLNKLNHQDRNKYIVIGGDFNIDMLNTKNKKRQEFIDFMLSFNLKQLINEPTRVTKKSKTCIDLILTNYKSFVNKAYVQDYGLSDHKSVNIKLRLENLPHPNKKPWVVEKRVYTNKRIICMKNSLKEIDWTTITKNSTDINTNYTTFHLILQNLLNKHIPKEYIKIRDKPIKGWLTKSLKISCKHKRVLRTLLNESNCNILRNYYKQYSKILKRSIKISKKLEYTKQMRKSDNKYKTMWKIINTKTGKISCKSYKNIKLKINDEIIECPKTICEIFSETFSNTNKNINANTHHHHVINSPTFSMYLQPVDQKEIQKIIASIKNKHSCGVDEIPPILIKKCAEELSEPLTYLVNQSFQEGTFPDLLKISLIKPIHKKEDTTIPTNYRPIALLPSFSKIFEKAMCNRIYAFLEKYNILDESQNGFRKLRSTTQAVYKYVQKALEHINHKHYGVGLLLDMSKAYENVDYNILLSKLHGSGIRGPSYLWFKSYLENRKQQIQIESYDSHKNKVQTTKSEEKTLTCSIPQGSVLGCVLFLIYINDLPKIIKNETTLPILFADDISILIKADKTDTANARINETLKQIISWLQDHNLQINFSKTKIIQFRPYNKPPLYINNTFTNKPIESVTSFNLLGIVIDTYLNWKKHIEHVKSKLSKFTYALYEIVHSTSTEAALAAYYAYAYSQLKYGIILWGNSTDVNELFILQKKCIRIIANIDNRHSCRPYFIKLNLLTLPSIYIHDICIFTFKNIKNFTKVKDTHNINTRHKDRLYLPPSRIKMLNTSPYYMSVKIFNKLPYHIKNEPNIKSFSKMLRSYLISKCFYSVNDYLNDK